MSIAAIATNYALAPKKNAAVNQRWVKPSEGFLKLNVDGSFQETTGSGSTGAVIRDASGGFIAAAHSFLPHVLDAAMAEVSALRDGLLLAQQIGCYRLEVQADCLEVVNTMLDGGFSATASAPIFDECSQIWKEFVAISISHCNRESNSVAHELARLAMVLKDSVIWAEEPPPSILQLLVNDVTILVNQ